MRIDIFAAMTIGSIATAILRPIVNRLFKKPEAAYNVGDLVWVIDHHNRALAAKIVDVSAEKYIIDKGGYSEKIVLPFGTHQLALREAPE